MAEDTMHLEDLDDEGEEVDYEDFNLEDFGEASNPRRLAAKNLLVRVFPPKHPPPLC